MKKKVLLLSLALGFPATALLAQAPHGPGKGGPGGPPPSGGPRHDGSPVEVRPDPHRNPMFYALLRALDTDGDGIISLSEMNHAAKSLLALDKDNDGQLSYEELVPHQDHKDGPPPHPPGPKPNNNDKPDKAEKPDAADDGNKPDGERHKPRLPKGGNNDSNGGNPATPPVPREDEERSALVDAIDTTHDGIISAAEIAAARANLKKLDRNNDGKLDPREYGRPHAKTN